MQCSAHQAKCHNGWPRHTNHKSLVFLSGCLHKTLITDNVWTNIESLDGENDVGFQFLAVPELLQPKHQNFVDRVQLYFLQSLHVVLAFVAVPGIVFVKSLLLLEQVQTVVDRHTVGRCPRCLNRISVGRVVLEGQIVTTSKDYLHQQLTQQNLV